MNTATNYLYGPKANNQWPSTGTSLVGPAGATGPQALPERAAAPSSFGADHYPFSAKERAYFERLQMQFQAQLGAAIALLCTQNDLSGQWQIAPDGSGLMKVG